jgi:DNA-directed RNA polymerase specialized sigma subunit
MQIRATVTLRNAKLIAARERMNLTQKAAALLCGVPAWLLGQLERLQFPKTYRYAEALLIADALHIDVEDILPEELVGWEGQTKLNYVEDIPVQRLLRYKDTQERHWQLPSPVESASAREDTERIVALVADCPNITETQRLIIQQRYGIGSHKPPQTRKQVAENLKCCISTISGQECVALFKLRQWFERCQRLKQNEGVETE